MDLTNEPQGELIVPDQDEPHLHGFAIPITIPDALLVDRELRRMEADSLSQRVSGLLDSLNADQLIVLRHILNLDSRSPTNNYIDGQVVALLRVVHLVDPDTGLTEQETLERAGTLSQTP